MIVGCFILRYYPSALYNSQTEYVPPIVPKPIIPISINYPDTIRLMPNVTGLYVSFELRANSTIAENTTIIIFNPYAEIVSPKYSNVWLVKVLFEELVPICWNITEPAIFEGGIAWGVVFTHLNGTNRFSSVNDSPYKWLVSGDYSPTIEIQFYNGSLTEYTYNQIKIHVASAVDMQNQKLAIENQRLAVQEENLNRVNVGLTYALVVVAVVEVIRIIEDTARGEEKKYCYQS